MPQPTNLPFGYGIARWLVVLACIPVGYRIGGIEFSMMDVCIPPLCLWVLLSWDTIVAHLAKATEFLKRTVLVLLAALVAWAVVGIFAPHLSVFSTGLTAGYFLRSNIFVLPAVVVIGLSPERNYRFFLTAIAAIVAIFTIPMLRLGSSVRREFFSDVVDGIVVQMNGSFLGLPLFGLGQVNTFAVLVAIGACAAFLCGIDSRSSVLVRSISIAVAFASSVVCLQSGSRSGVLVLAAFGTLTLRRLAKRPSHFVLTIGFFFLGTLAVLSPSTLGLPSLTSERLQERLSVSQLSNIDAFSSGRSHIYARVMSDLFRSPIVGTGFGDFDLFHSTETLLDSPHNQWLGAFHKMGLLGGIPYVLLIWWLLKAIPSSSIKDAVLAGLASTLVLDSLTVPVVAPSLLVLIAVGTNGFQNLLPGPALANTPEVSPPGRPLQEPNEETIAKKHRDIANRRDGSVSLFDAR